MPIFSILYDLKDTAKDYTSFFNEVQSLGNYTQVLSNTYIVDIEGQLNTSNIYNRLKPELGESDHILVCMVNPIELSGFLSSDSVEWIKKARETNY